VDVGPPIKSNSDQALRPCYKSIFVIKSLLGSMSLAHIQAFYGDSTPWMTLHDAQLMEDDLLATYPEQ